MSDLTQAIDDLANLIQEFDSLAEENEEKDPAASRAYLVAGTCLVNALQAARAAEYALLTEDS